MNLTLYIAIAAAIFLSGLGVGFTTGQWRARSTLVAPLQEQVKAAQGDAAATSNALQRVIEAHAKEIAARERIDKIASDINRGLTDENEKLTRSLDRLRKASAEEAARDPGVTALLRTPFPAGFRERMRDAAADVPPAGRH